MDSRVPPGSSPVVRTTAVVGGPSGAAAEIPVSTAASTASTASLRRCHETARRKANQGRRGRRFRLWPETNEVWYA